MARKSDFSYDLPSELIAQEPCAERDGSRLLVVGDDAGLSDQSFGDLPDHVPADAVIVVNDTRVLPARLYARKPTGGRVEVFVTRMLADNQCEAMIKRSARLRPGMTLVVEGDDGADFADLVLGARDDKGLWSVAFSCAPADVMMSCGQVPLPPYIEREHGASDADRERYQTIFADNMGAVAAPTAGLHFTERIRAALIAKGCRFHRITLHVGLGTFAPMRVDDIASHKMHAEWYHVPAETVAAVCSERPVVAVGTTVVRALESAAQTEGWERGQAVRGETRLYIRPGFRFRAVDKLITNFHLPESSLLIMVSAFSGRERILGAYRHAIAERYRFFSYGDAMLLSRAS